MQTSLAWKNFQLLESTTPEMLVAGVDEVGRGALFGPVFAAAVVLPLSKLPELLEIGVKDSKKLSCQRRLELIERIEQLTLARAISYATAKEIDRINILQASLLAMKKALLKLRVQPSICLVDGNQAIPGFSISQITLVKGDERSPAIAAASIIAKVWRDELIVRLANQYPHYDLISNKGYGSAKHLLALRQYGPSPQHRMSFRPCQLQPNSSRPHFGG